MSEKQEAEPTKPATTTPEAAQPTDTKLLAAQLSNDPATDKKLRETVEAAIGSAIGVEETRAEVVERVVRIVTAEFFRGPLPHPRHLQAYENACPGLADGIVALAEKAHSRQEDRIDKAMNFEYDDRRLGLFLGFFALLALLISGTLIVWLGNVVVGAGLLGAAVLGTAIGTFVHGRRSEEESSPKSPSQNKPDQTTPNPERSGILKRIFSIFSAR